MEPGLSISLAESAYVAVISEVGQIIIYAFTVTNTGNVTLTDVVAEDTMITGEIELDITTLALGETASGAAHYTVTGW